MVGRKHQTITAAPENKHELMVYQPPKRGRPKGSVNVIGRELKEGIFANAAEMGYPNITYRKVVDYVDRITNKDGSSEPGSLLCTLKAARLALAA